MGSDTGSHDLPQAEADAASTDDSCQALPLQLDVGFQQDSEDLSQVALGSKDRLEALQSSSPEITADMPSNEFNLPQAASGHSTAHLTHHSSLSSNHTSSTGLDALSGDGDDFAEHAELAPDLRLQDVADFTGQLDTEAARHLHPDATDGDIANVAHTASSDAQLDKMPATGNAMQTNEARPARPEETVSEYHDAQHISLTIPGQPQQRQPVAQQQAQQESTPQPNALDVISQPYDACQRPHYMSHQSSQPSSQQKVAPMTQTVAAAQATPSAPTSEEDAEEQQKAANPSTATLTGESAMAKAEQAEQRLLTGKLLDPCFGLQGITQHVLHHCHVCLHAIFVLTGGWSLVDFAFRMQQSHTV